MKENMKRIGALLGLFMAVIGAACGVGYIVAYACQVESMAAEEAVMPVMGMVALVWCAWPKMREMWDVINGVEYGD